MYLSKESITLRLILLHCPTQHGKERCAKTEYSRTGSRKRYSILMRSLSPFVFATKTCPCSETPLRENGPMDIEAKEPTIAEAYAWETFYDDGLSSVGEHQRQEVRTVEML